jgi:hypothetical protein
MSVAFEFPKPKPEDEPTFHCRECYDEPNGWIVCLCPGRGKFINPSCTTARASRVVQCVRHQDHPPHTYAERCPCVPSNPTIKRHRDRMADARNSRATNKGE